MKKKKPKSYWNYRIMKRVLNGQTVFAMFEVHYTGNRVTGWTKNPLTPYCESKADVIWELKKMLTGTKKRVLNYDKDSTELFKRWQIV